MSRSGSYSSGSRTPSYSRGSSARYPPGTPDFDRYSRSSYSRSGAESPDYDQYSASSSVSNGRYTASESIRSSYSRRSSRYGNESPLHSSVRGDERSESGSLRQSRRLSEKNGPLTSKSVSFDPDQVSPASEDEDYEAISPRSKEVSVSRRESAASNVASTLGRASSSVMEKVEQVRDFWKMFYIKWGTPTLVVLILIPALYYGRETVFDMMDLVRGARRQLNSKLDDIKYDAEIQAGIPQPFNLTAHLEPIWQQYSDILDNKDYETWFFNARDAEDAILAMWNALPTSNNKTVDEIQQDIKMKGFIDYRMALRKRSEVNLENFLLSRSRVLGEMLQLTNSWGRYVHNTLSLNSSNAVILEPKEKERFAAYGFTENSTTGNDQVENKTAYVLDHAAERLLNNMIKLHDGLVITREAHWPMEKANADWSDTPTKNSSAEEIDEWMLKSFALHDIKHARELEARFIDSLVKQSPYAELWDNGRSHSTSLQTLEEKLASLQFHLYELRQKIVAALGQLSIESVIQIPDQEPRIIPLHFWAQNVDEILATCGKTLQKPSQSLTRAEIHYGTLKANMAQFRGRQQLIRWRRENCGDTTCFDLAPGGAWGRFVGAAQQGLSLMSPGQPRKPFARRPPKMVGLERQDGEKTEAVKAGQYEKRCCGWSGENLWLDYLRFGAKELVYLDPYRIDSPREQVVETEQDTES
ncbi:hypothetical protein PFICI_14910 [Pestalotiopsis fici W106-1]|uniref:Uncharacterized protein n=1 Tax=Pestalotiopsis fici (strain W106-1 / CGMCC3.15140) TaxID=1229662 RepID=W3WHB6_PESFW|nr:uncharacterized protein PFICI_14910 [Pestalotiopsis fici W106-1]ETS73305.1 hypothetical protein PFICI_14910 [Pestalotiopsis fici W106-1]